MYSGNLINDLCAMVERVLASIASPSRTEAQCNLPSPQSHSDSCVCRGASLEPEQFPQALRLRAADGDLGLLLVIHPQLVRTLEPGHDFADVIDVHEE